MKKVLWALLIVFLLLAGLVVAVVVVTPRVSRFDPVKIAGDAMTGYGANSPRHRNAQQLPSPWDPMGDANRRVEAIPFEDRAYPLFAEAAAMLEAADVMDLLRNRPGDDGWDETLDWIRTEEAQAIIRVLDEAAGKPEPGFPLTNGAEPILEAARVRHGLVADTDMPSTFPSLLDIYLPLIGKKRSVAQLLCVDAEAAVLAGDRERYTSSLVTLFDLLRHDYETDLLIEQVLNGAVASLARSQLQRTLLEEPNFLDEAACARIEAAIARAEADGLHAFTSRGECVLFEDQIRRFVDDRGVFNTQGFSAATDGGATGTAPSSVVRASINADLLATYTEYEKWALAAEAAVEVPYSFKPLLFLEESTTAWVEGADSVPGSIGRLLMSTLLPAWKNAAGRYRFSVQEITALRVALAANRHRLRHGDPPLGISDIDDDLMTFDPIDGFTGGPLQFRWRDGRPFVYAYGPDKDDDGGVHILDDEGKPWRSISDELLESKPDGDFVLFPMPEE